MLRKKPPEALLAKKAFSKSDIVLKPAGFGKIHVFFNNNGEHIKTGVIEMYRGPRSKGDLGFLSIDEKKAISKVEFPKSLRIESFEPFHEFSLLKSGYLFPAKLEGRGFGKAVFAKLMEEIKNKEHGPVHLVEIDIASERMAPIAAGEGLKRRDPESREYYRLV